jgi:hypothetical protein
MVYIMIVFSKKTKTIKPHAIIQSSTKFHLLLAFFNTVYTIYSDIHINAHTFCVVYIVVVKSTLYKYLASFEELGNH